MFRIAFIGLLVGIIAAAVGIAQNSSLTVAVAFGVVLACLEVYVLTKAAGGFTAVLLPVLTVNSVFLPTPFIWRTIQADALVSLPIADSEDLHIQAVIIGIAFCAAYTVGALLAGPRRLELAGVQQLLTSDKARNGVLVAAGYGGLFLAIYGLQGALLQGRYLQSNGPSWAVSLSSVAIPLAVLVWAIAATRGGPWSIFAIVGIAIMVLVLFSKSSRLIALVPILIITARVFVPGVKVRLRSLAFAGAATIILLQLALAGRSNPDGVGIIPLGRQLLADPGSYFSQFSGVALLGNLLVSEPLTGMVANQTISSQAFWVSVNPLPGSFVGWSEMSESLRFNLYTPYNALGELAAHGWIALSIVAATAGYLLSISTRIASNREGAYQAAASMLVLAASTFFALSILQYNLRSGVRLIWYELTGLTAIWFASIAFRRRYAKRKDKSNPEHVHSRHHRGASFAEHD